jgi:hypothetical protein
LNIEHNYEKVYANGSGSKQGGHDGKTETLVFFFLSSNTCFFHKRVLLMRILRIYDKKCKNIIIILKKIQ